MLLLSLSAAVQATGPYDTTSSGGDSRLMLKGHDPVAYFAQGKIALGDAAIKTDFDGVTYRFVSEEHRFEFMKNPYKYTPQFGGFCANSMVYALPWPGEPDSWKIIDGRLHLFGGEWPRRYFLMDEDNNERLARRYWKDEVEGSIPIVQRARRLAIRVPHYKSDKELAAAWRTLTGEAP
ncbi:MAG: YHS domain-containing (seleno)protein [Betaproteobacteria bacterium]